MRYSLKKKEKAIALRKQGCSIKEVAQKMNIAKSTSSLWLREVELNKKAQKRLKNRKIFGQYKARKTVEKKREEREKRYALWAKEVLQKTSKTKNSMQLYCAILYWAEGGKFTDTHLEFTNSDPQMIRFFLKLLRKGFNINEEKLKANIHLHEYHNELKQKRFWCNVTKVPFSQFNKSYLKPHTRKRIRPNYSGCVRICYYSADVARKIKALYSNIEKYV